MSERYEDILEREVLQLDPSCSYVRYTYKPGKGPEDLNASDATGKPSRCVQSIGWLAGAALVILTAVVLATGL